MTPAKHRRVALIIESSRSYGRRLLQGIANYSRIQENWSLLHEEMSMSDALPDWISQERINGAIVRLDRHNIEPLIDLKIPVIDVLCSRVSPGIPRIETDDQVVARLAFEHLWERGFRHFAFCGYRGAHYSENRLRYFREAVAATNSPLSVYESDGDRNEPLKGVERSGVSDAEPLSRWLSELRSPTGLLVCHDIRGQQVLNACHQLGISVPDDIGVVGVDDDDTICPLSNPPLTSVCPDAEQVGYRAAETLQAMMDGDAPSADIEFIRPKGVVQRLSTQVVAVEDREIARVCRFIRESACDGIDVGDVAMFTTLSRRQLERRFRTELDSTPHQEITSVQVMKVQQLLTETELSLEKIAPLAGYLHKEHLGTVFKRETGQTPGEFRHKNRESHRV